MIFPTPAKNYNLRKKEPILVLIFTVKFAKDVPTNSL